MVVCMTTQTTAYQDLAARHRAGEITYTDLLRGRRALGVHRVALAMRDANRRGARQGAHVLRSTSDRHRYTDEWCTERLSCGAPGLEREAALLLELETPTQRAEAVRLAHQLRNATADAGRWSDAIRSCLADARRVA